MSLFSIISLLNIFLIILIFRLPSASGKSSTSIISHIGTQPVITKISFHIVSCFIKVDKNINKKPKTKKNNCFTLFLSLSIKVLSTSSFSPSFINFTLSFSKYAFLLITIFIFSFDLANFAWFIIYSIILGLTFFHYIYLLNHIYYLNRFLFLFPYFISPIINFNCLLIYIIK